MCVIVLYLDTLALSPTCLYFRVGRFRPHHFFPFLGAGVCVSLDIFPHVGLVWVALPSSYQPKLSGSNGVQNGMMVFALHVPGCVTADIVADVINCSVDPAASPCLTSAPNPCTSEWLCRTYALAF